jgi:PemK-like, MazF-like toxin of type II toxin-antitoxin system
MDHRSGIKGKVVLVPFPFDDLTSEKVRPAVCLTEPIGPYGHIILAFISTQIPDQPLDSDLFINSRDSDFSLTGLRATSSLRLHRLMTVTSSIIKRELGRLSTRMQKEVDYKLLELFSLKVSK